MYNSFEDYYKSNSSKEQDDIRGYETKINQLVKDLDKAKTREGKAKINAEIKKYSEEQKKITDSKYVYTETKTQIALGTIRNKI